MPLLCPQPSNSCGPQRWLGCYTLWITSWLTVCLIKWFTARLKKGQMVKCCTKVVCVMIPDCCHGVSFRLTEASFVQYAAFRMLPLNSLFHRLPSSFCIILKYFCVFFSQDYKLGICYVICKCIWMYFCSSFCMLRYNTVSVGEEIQRVPYILTGRRLWPLMHLL